MSYSVTSTETRTFTLTHAKHLAAKVATDLMRMHRLYGKPSVDSIANYEAELTELLRLGYLDNVAYGFRRNEEWIEPTLRYTARELGEGAVDDDPGRVRPNMDISGASFYSYLIKNLAWNALSPNQQQAIEKSLAIQRSSADEPTVAGGGMFVDDRNYSSGGRSLGRQSIRRF
jgi:hypothetical protein